MGLDIHLYHHFVPDTEILSRLDAMSRKLDLVLSTGQKIQQMETKIMAAIDDELAAIKASLDTIQTGVTALLAKIAAMPTAGLTPAQQSALDGIAAEAQGIATAANPTP